MKKRILASMLSLLAVSMVMPITAFAESDPPWGGY